MLHTIKDDFDETTDDILNSINNMLSKKDQEKAQEEKTN